MDIEEYKETVRKFVKAYEGLSDIDKQKVDRLLKFPFKVDKIEGKNFMLVGTKRWNLLVKAENIQEAEKKALKIISEGHIKEEIEGVVKCPFEFIRGDIAEQGTIMCTGQEVTINEKKDLLLGCDMAEAIEMIEPRHRHLIDSIKRVNIAFSNE